MDLAASGQSLNLVRVSPCWDIINMVTVLAQNRKRATARGPLAEGAVHPVESGMVPGAERHRPAARFDCAMVG
jgi:hypothetical protein